MIKIASAKNLVRAANNKPHKPCPHNTKVIADILCDEVQRDLREYYGIEMPLALKYPKTSAWERLRYMNASPERIHRALDLTKERTKAAIRLTEQFKRWGDMTGFKSDLRANSFYQSSHKNLLKTAVKLRSLYRKLPIELRKTFRGYGIRNWIYGGKASFDVRHGVDKLVVDLKKIKSEDTVSRSALRSFRHQLIKLNKTLMKMSQHGYPYRELPRLASRVWNFAIVESEKVPKAIKNLEKDMKDFLGRCVESYVSDYVCKS